MTSGFYVQEASFDISYMEPGRVSLGLACNVEDIKKLFSIVEESHGKIQISKFEEKDPSVAEKFRQETIDNTIKAIYAGIEKTVADYGFTFGTYLSNMTPQSYNKIVQEFESKGFQVNYEIDRSYLKISWK